MIFDFLEGVHLDGSIIDYPGWLYVAPAVQASDIKETFYVQASDITVRTVLGGGN